jgi:hypothetical protein
MRPFVGGRFDALDQRQHGISLSLHGRFEADGFNTVPEVAAGFAAARRFGHVLLLAHGEYGHGLAESEHNAALGLAVTQRVSDLVRVGVDSHFRIDLERDQHEPELEPDWQLQAGPLAAATIGSLCATMGGGVSALRYRLSTTNHLGAVAYAGLGAVF